MRVIAAYKRHRRNRRIPADILTLAHAAYWYIREYDHPLPDNLMITHDLEVMREARANLSHESIQTLISRQD
jgi:hypothetical protein